MKKVYLLGDSIRMGYEQYVRELLADEAKVYAPDENGRFTSYTYSRLPFWKNEVDAPEEVSVVHWNNGHWDAAHWELAPDPQHDPEEYGVWLKRVYGMIRRCFPNAQVIFATTTGICQSRFHEMTNVRTNEQLAEYNRVAKSVMAELGVTVNDLAETAAAFPDDYYKDYTHYGETGCRLLAEQVVRAIREKL